MHSMTHLILYPHDRATGNVILKGANGKWFGFGAKTLKDRLEIAAHYSGHGLQFELCY